jgi:RimJ/RimL family protein N-acetyltransferase
MLKFRKASIEDVKLFFNWANDTLVRSNSYQKETITYKDHVKWFDNQVKNDDIFFYVFLNEFNIPIGQVRINKSGDNKAVIGLMVGAEFRGKGFAKEMIQKASEDFLTLNHTFTILAYIFKTNKSSLKSFTNAGYELLNEEIIKKVPSFILYKNKQ